MLEYLCLEKIEKGAAEAVFSGETNWNWIEEKRGIFHIIINAQMSDKIFFSHAMRQSISLLEKILSKSTSYVMLIDTATNIRNIPAEIPMNNEYRGLIQ